MEMTGCASLHVTSGSTISERRLTGRTNRRPATLLEDPTHHCGQHGDVPAAVERVETGPHYFHGAHGSPDLSRDQVVRAGGLVQHRGEFLLRPGWRLGHGRFHLLSAL